MHLRKASFARWVLPVALIVLLAALPSLVGRVQARPASGTADVTAAEVLTRVQAARSTGWSGNAETRGGLALPVTDVFSDLVDLAGSTTTVRAWWSDPLSWRIDRLSPVGEVDVVRDAEGSWEWDYQRGRATRVPLDPDPRVRLPAVVDLLPPTLAERLVSQATPTEASRLPGREVAGHDTYGLRVRPSEPQTSVDHVDLWADVDSGVALRVEVVGKGADAPAVAATFLDVEIGAPPADRLRFDPPEGADISTRDDPRDVDIASAVDRYSRARPPATLAGLDGNDRLPPFGAVGVYGRGVTEVVAVPLSTRFSGGLRDELRDAAPATPSTPAGGGQDDGRIALGVGPLNLLVTAVNRTGRFWLVAGTVTAETLQQAATELEALPPEEFR